LLELRLGKDYYIFFKINNLEIELVRV